MFGGTCFLIGGHMLLGTLNGTLIVRVGRDAHAAALELPDTRPFDVTGRPMAGFVTVDGPSLSADATLDAWIGRALDFVSTLPPKDSARKPARGKRRRGR
jgi:hypothetical protein